MVLEYLIQQDCCVPCQSELLREFCGNQSKTCICIYDIIMNVMCIGNNRTSPWEISREKDGFFFHLFPYYLLLFPWESLTMQSTQLPQSPNCWNIDVHHYTLLKRRLFVSEVFPDHESGIKCFLLGITQASDPSTQDAEAGKFLWVWGQPQKTKNTEFHPGQPGLQNETQS